MWHCSLSVRQDERPIPDAEWTPVQAWADDATALHRANHTRVRPRLRGCTTDNGVSGPIRRI
ncbi:hypothetical protein Acy02nite_02830 [Actinoplanes cyaneus]|uniref:Uncharacterized protein n=1 Tax=Actinoplanes cyaneus TaxID=52696 RepID=A0A919IDI2_9ACTN|nr:hypothetical protein Acy02nite_02830 [Actinoplanes cyaneus]